MALFITPILALFALILTLGGCNQKSQDQTADSAKFGDSGKPSVRWDTLKTQVKAGESFHSIAHNLGLCTPEANRLLQGIKENFEFKLYAGQSYRVITKTMDSLRVLESFVLEDRYTDAKHILTRQLVSGDTLHVSLQGLHYAKVEIPIRLDTVPVTGNINTNLYEAFVSKGETPSLIQAVTKIFAWDIDFFKDPRIGDAFSLLVEKRFDEEGRFRGYGQVLSAKYVNRGREFYGIYFNGSYFDQNGSSLEKMLLKVPLNFAHMTSGFSPARLHPILGVKRPHWGVDYAAPKGTPIFAAGDGTIEYAKWIGGYGKTIKVRHNGVYSTYYAHLNGYASGISSGRRVHQGETIGYLGMTGLATGPHLDYRVEYNGKFINPTSLKMEAKEGIAQTEWKDFCVRRDHLLARMNLFASQHLAKL